MNATMNATRKIVVGVDGSENSLRALKWALAEARLRGDRVEVLHGWHFPYVADPTGVGAYPTDAFAESAELVLREAMAACTTEAEGVDVTTTAVQSGGANFLVEASSGADLLVVGRRGHGGFISLVMGSVAHQVVSHAHCPVVVVGPS